MLATFIFEFGAAFYTIWRYKMTTVSRLAFIILLALGTFQLTEYMICGGLGWTHVEWARLGYGAITLLPALGIHMVVTLAKKKLPILVGFAYLTCLAFLMFFLFADGAVTAEACYSNYAVFNSQKFGAWPFAYYYYGWLLVGTMLALEWSKQLPKRKKALTGMAVGYLAFILPTTLFNIVDPSTVSGIPSIMCGFAVLFALTLVFRVLPNSTKRRS
jgi:hypothetical protein